MFAVRLDEEMEREVDMIAKARGSNRSEIVREAIIRYLEDNEDLEMARIALSGMKRTKSIQQLRDELGLGD